MKQNKYDEKAFFDKYSLMERSVKGLEGAGEWPALKKLLPNLKGKTMLDLGCGFGWHCQYALEQGARQAVGVDISEKMLAEGRRKFPQVEFRHQTIEDIDFPENSFDLILSSLAFHYIASFEDICRQAAMILKPGGDFVFSVEHPVFTAQGTQDWCYDQQGGKKHWPVDGYFQPGPRQAVFLGEEVVKYHRPLTLYLGSLLDHGFEIKALVEPTPGRELIEAVPDMADELRRPMMLILAAALRP